MTFIDLSAPQFASVANVPQEEILKRLEALEAK
jgi:hypothetical protein